MAKKTKFYTVSGMKRVCMGTDTLSYPPLFTSKKAAAKFIADRMNEAIDEFNKWPNHAHTEHIKAADCVKFNGYQFGDFCLSIVEHNVPQSTLVLTAREASWLKNFFQYHIDEIADLDGGTDYEALMTIDDKIKKL